MLGYGNGIGGRIGVTSFFTTYLLASFVGSFIILQNVVRSYSISNRSLCSASSEAGLRIIQTRTYHACQAVRPH
jgi:hypothetical protein